MRPGQFISRAAFPVIFALIGLALPASAGAKDKVLSPASYPDTTTYSCRTDAITIHPGQNLNLVGATKTCPNAEVVRGPGGTGVFSPGSTAEGYVTRFQPSMAEIKPGGELVTPSVWDLHLHHVVWIAPDGGPTFASGEEDDRDPAPGLRAQGRRERHLGAQLHDPQPDRRRRAAGIRHLDDRLGPGGEPLGRRHQSGKIEWLDVAGRPQIYPVFDAERGFDADGDGKYVFPDEVPDDPAAAGFEERRKISPAREWTVPDGGATLVSGAGHLHPGGLHVDLEVARDGPDAGEVDGDRRSEVKKLFRSDAHHDQAGAVSWDVSMEATRRGWRIGLKRRHGLDRRHLRRQAGVVVRVDGDPPAVRRQRRRPEGQGPVRGSQGREEDVREGGILTHGRLPENIDRPARDKLGLEDPRASHPAGLRGLIGHPDRQFPELTRRLHGEVGIPLGPMRPPGIEPGDTVTFTSLDALPTMPQTEQAWHTVTSCKPPCNRGPGIGYPLAGGPVKFDSGQLGFGSGRSSEVTTGSNVYTTPPLTKPGRTYTYFCRIHPFMRGSIRVAGKPRG